YTLYDSLLRPLQTQSPTPRGGRLLTDTRYDTRGLAYDTYADIFDTSSTPNSTYTRAEYGEAPTQTQTVFDGAGRATTSSLYVYGVKKWSTTTTYTGDSVATTALEGGSARRTITDVRGQTTESREYASTSPADSGFGTGPGASYTFTKFTYALDGQQKSITGPDGAKWTYDYDLFGRQISTGDPDKGTTTTEYNALDQIIKSTDSRGTSLLTAYDELGRATGTWTGSKTDANQLTGYTYDTVLKGLPTSSTRYVGGKTGAAYTQTVTAYDSLDRATATQLELPASDPFVKAGAPSTLAFETYYNIDGTQQYDKQPALGGLPSEIIGFTYDGLGNLTSIGGSTGYLNNVSYSALTQPEELTLGTGGTGNKNVYVKNSYEEGTGRLLRSYVKDQTRPYMLQDLNYTYDQTGNVTAISDPTTLGGTSSPDTQCFAYDGHQRLTEAWTPASQKCSDAPNASSLSGPAPYWTSYTYNTAGQRTSETVHQSSGDTKTTYCYTNAKQPHTLTGTTTKADCASPQRTYDYDTTGNTRHRPGTTATQELDWSPEGKLTKLTENATSTDYLYAADGTLLIRATKNGERILYAGATELHLRVNGTTWAQRYYTAGAVTAAVRSNESGTNKLTYLTGDHHGTSTLAISPDTAQAFTKRYTTPFGADRGTPLYGPWPDDKGFLGKTRDTTTGLTHIGAREYDPAIGQFISVDPLLVLDQAQSFNGYAYASNNPVTYSDPTGLCMDPGNGRCMPDDGGRGGPQQPDPAYPLDPGVTYGNGGKGNGTANTGTGSGIAVQKPSGGGCGFWDVKCGWDQLWKSECGFWDIKCGFKENYHAWKNAVVVLSPLEDAENCRQQDYSACGWLVAGFLPIGKLKGLAKALESGEDAAKAAQRYAHGMNLAGKIAYGEGHLSQAVQLQRLIDKNKTGNYAAALLSDGTTLVARSGGGPHAEEKLLDAAGDKIVALYSERQPCDGTHNCTAKIASAGIKNVSWSFDWNSSKAVQEKANKELKAAISELFKK
ncbi:RHS repeat-associated core domain-containing protein, partial [Streptomyces kebangsaanensis]|uniref:RHS repeat-associated core domain-containing protein n=1 Tax=Streptomyces kebangsaanensis TaxID=864058 RepID=UPI000A43DDD7